MFNGCTQLAEIKVGFTDWGQMYTTDSDSEEIWNTQDWLIDVAPNGKFICPKKLPKEFGESRMPEEWKIIRN